MSENSDCTFSVVCSYLEIYKEKIRFFILIFTSSNYLFFFKNPHRDLLSPNTSETALEVRQSKEKGIFVTNLEEQVHFLKFSIIISNNSSSMSEMPKKLWIELQVGHLIENYDQQDLTMLVQEVTRIKIYLFFFSDH